MKISNKIISTIAMAVFSTSAIAQGLNSAYFTQDYKYRHDMNPAFDNEQSYIAVPFLGNVNAKTLGTFGYKDVVLDNPLYPTSSDKKKTTFMNPYIDGALDGFRKGDNIMAVEGSVAILSAGFKGFKGYNTIELNSRSNVSTILPYELFEFARNTGNKTYNIGDISLEAQSFVELAFGHSRDINSKLRVGGKLKVLFGIANATFDFKNVTADLQSANEWTISGDAQAHASMKGLTYTTRIKENQTGTGTFERITGVDVNGAGIGGIGLAIDLGGVYKVNENLTISAAVLDLGFIHWSNDMHAENKDKSFTFDGFHDVSVHSGGDNPIEHQFDEYNDQIVNFINLQDRGDDGGHTSGIGARINVGAEYILPAYRKLSFGLLGSQKIDGKYSWTEGRLSANIAPLKWLDGGLSFALNTYTGSAGWILNIHPSKVNFFIGMDHIIGKFSKEFIPISSNGSINVGFNVVW